jgi:hypothetical protein
LDGRVPIPRGQTAAATKGLLLTKENGIMILAATVRAILCAAHGREYTAKQPSCFARAKRFAAFRRPMVI